jgi:hypothetical protein
MVPSIRTDDKQVKPLVLAQVVSVAALRDEAFVEFREDFGLSALPII